MAKHSGILTGTAGVYYVASQLAARGFHAAVTYGNAPSVDILVGTTDGSATLSLQIKTSRSALRTQGRGEKKAPLRYEWAVGEKAAKLQRDELFFAFVDLGIRKWEPLPTPDVFIVPSKVVFEAFDIPYFKSQKRRYWRWHPKIEIVEQYKNNWSILQDCLKEKSRLSRT